MSETKIETPQSLPAQLASLIERSSEVPSASQESFQALSAKFAGIIESSPNRGGIVFAGRRVKGVETSGWFRYRGRAEEDRALSVQRNPSSGMLSGQFSGKPSLGLEIKHGGVQQVSGETSYDGTPAWSMKIDVVDDDGDIKVMCGADGSDEFDGTGNSIYPASEELVDWIDGQLDEGNLVPVTTPEAMRHDSLIERVLGRLGLTS